MRILIIATLCLAACGENQTHPMRDPYVRPDGGTALECLPNLDGRIDAAELAPAVGVPVQYLVSPAGEDRPVDVAGTVDAAGRRVWDWSIDVASDRAAMLAARPLAERWFAAEFPGGEIAVPVDAAGTLEGVYRHDDDALRLLGIASAAQDPPEGRTLLRYTAPVELYRFPLQPGAEHVSVGEVVGGTVRGLPYAGRDTYEVSVDATGELRLPDLSFEQAHRARVRVTVEPSVGTPVSRRQVSFLFECFGEVARATSRDGETSDDFAIASEVRRLGL